METDEREIPPDLVRTSAVEPNIRAVSHFAQLANEALVSLQFTGSHVALVLPDLAVRAFAVPSDVKSNPSRILAYIAPRLSYPSSEALVDTWQWEGDWTLAVAVRRIVLRQYEQALEALGCHVSWVDAASLIGIQEWIRNPPGVECGGLRILLQLYPRHFVLSIMKGGELRDLRVKLRSGGDESRIVDQIGRVPSLFDGAPVGHLTVQGEGASRLFERMDSAGVSGDRIHLGQDGEQSHLSDMLRFLLLR